MAHFRQTYLDPILSELNDDEPPQGEDIAGQVSAQLNALPRKCGELVRAYSMPEGSEHETNRIYRARSALARRGQPVRCAALLVAHWLRTCERNHPQCLQPPPVGSRSSWWPRRLVDLINYEPDAASGTSCVRVVETGSQGEPYCVLSYRRPPNPVYLNSETSRELSGGLPSTKLCGSIRDACTLAKHLGVRYVWVDTLCIMQEDSHREARKIADIYINALFTVAIVDQTRLVEVASVQPFLSEQHRFASMDDSLANPENVYSKLSDTGNFVFRDEGDLDGYVWCFQEKMLSRRIISITKKDIFWDCLHYSASGRRPCGVIGDFSPRFRDLDDRTFKRLLLGVPAAGVDQAEAYWQWRKAVENYTMRLSTPRKDRLLALEGITNRMSQVLGDSSVVGIWSKDAIRSLIWFSPQTGDTRDLPDIKAPSWSWASVSGPISYRLWHPYERHLHRKGEALVPAAVVEDMSAVSETYGDFTRSRGTLQIHGPVIEAHAMGDTIFVRKDRCPAHVLPTRDGTAEASKAIYDDLRVSYDERKFYQVKLLLDPRPSAPKEGLARQFLSVGIPPRGMPPRGMPFCAREVKCLLLCEGGYYTPIKAQYCMVLERGCDIERFFSRRELYRRIGLCVIDSMWFSRQGTCRHDTDCRLKDGDPPYCAKASQESWAVHERVDIA